MLNLPDLFPAHRPTPSREVRSDIIECLYGAARDPQRWPDAMAQLAAHVGGNSAMMARCDLLRGSNSVVTGADGPVLAEAAQAPSEVWHLAREVARRTGGSAAGIRSGVAAVMPVAAGSDAKLTHLVLPHLALCGEGHAAWVSVALPAGRPPPDEAVRRFSSLRGHLTHALDISTELAQVRDAGSSLAILLSALPTAALMLDEGGRVMQANSAARAILNDRDGIHQTGERMLRVDLLGEDQKLAPAIRAALAASGGETGVNRLVVRLRRTAGRSPLLIILDPIEGRQPALATGGSGAVLMRMIDKDHAPGDRTYPLQAAFDLTAAEMRIAALIAAGLSPSLVARQLNVSTNTVRTHLARIFDKTGVRSQHALTLLLAAIGSWPIS